MFPKKAFQPFTKCSNRAEWLYLCLLIALLYTLKSLVGSAPPTALSPATESYACVDPLRYDLAEVRPKKIIIVSSGRTGSKLLWSMIIQQLKYRYRNVRHIHRFADEFEQTLVDRDTRVIYIYTDPVDVVLSLKLCSFQWVKTHFENFNSSRVHYSDFHNIFREDVLRLEEFFEGWMRPHPFPFFSLNYEHEREPESTQALLTFLGFPRNYSFQWPPANEKPLLGTNKQGLIPREHRIAEYPMEKQRLLLRTYRRARKKILSAPPYCIWPIIRG